MPDSKQPEDLQIIPPGDFASGITIYPFTSLEPNRTWPDPRAIDQYKLIIFDVDGTLRYTTVPGQPCPNRYDEWAWLPNVRERINALPDTMKIGMCSNQAGIALGYLDGRSARGMIYALQSDLKQYIPVECTQICPHRPDDLCICRKPEPAMIYAVMRAAHVYKRGDVLYVGDMESDDEAATRAGIAFMWAKDFFGW